MQFGDEMLTADDLLDEEKLDKVLAAQTANNDINNARGSQYGGSIASPTLNKQGSIESPKEGSNKLKTEPDKDEMQNTMDQEIDPDALDENDPNLNKDNSRLVDVVNTGIMQATDLLDFTRKQKARKISMKMELKEATSNLNSAPAAHNDTPGRAGQHTAESGKNTADGKAEGDGMPT